MPTPTPLKDHTEYKYYDPYPVENKCTASVCSISDSLGELATIHLIPGEKNTCAIPPARIRVEVTRHCLVKYGGFAGGINHLTFLDKEED